MLLLLPDLHSNAGPPGSGKTSTISVLAEELRARYSPVWVVAQSNVAVRNIAKNMRERGVKFKLLVSKEFYVEW